MTTPAQHSTKHGQGDPDRRALLGDERGDVPGWVLVTLMTAGLPAVTV